MRRVATLGTWIVALCIALSLAPLAPPAAAQGVDVTGRPVAEVRVTGLKQVDPQLVLNQVRIKAGDAYSPDAAAKDIQNITRLGRFSSVQADVKQNADGGIILTYVISEQPILADVQVVGNKAKTDQELMDLVLLRGGDPKDDFLIERAKDQIRKLYRDAGYFLADVSVDGDTLKESNVLIFRIREGPRVKVRGVRFEGNALFSDKELKSKIETSAYFPIFEKGKLSEEQLDQDAAHLRDFYQQRGYLDARIGRRIDISDDQESAVVVFLIDEGPQYTVRNIRFDLEGEGVFNQDMILQAMELKPGSVFSYDLLRKSTTAVKDLFGKLGYLSTDEGGLTRIVIERVFNEGTPTVDMVVLVREGKQYTVGNVMIRGNAGTQDRVVRREVRGLEPGRPYDRAGLDESVKRIRESGLFSQAKATVQGDPRDTTRDLLIEAKEGKTGSVSFGAAVSSDAGVVGAIDLNQRNFDFQDWPESWGEFISGRAFRGAGQQFGISLQPGMDLSRYSVNWADPSLFDTDYFVSSRVQFYQRERDRYDEQRLGGYGSFGKRFGDVWSATARGRVEQIDITNIDVDAPVDVFDVEGMSLISGIGLEVQRNTTDSRIFPTRGTRLVVGYEHVGPLGDYNYDKVSAEANAFFTVDEDFFGRKTVLSLRSEAGYILESDQAPTFEKFYAGGHSSFRGFKYRGVGPRGIRHDTLTLGDDPIGGEWMFLLGAEYNFPVWQEYVRWVFFVDSGTVQKDIGFDEWRVSVGTGVRLTLPFLGQAPFAFDLAYPLLTQSGDDKQYFSFSIALPF